MRVVRTATLAAALVLTALGGQAQADVGVTAGPGRQIVQGDGSSPVLVGNTGNEAARIRTYGLVFNPDTALWERSSTVNVQPKTVKLQPHTQAEVTAYTPAPGAAPCKLYAAGFGLQPSDPKAQIEVRGLVLAQLVVHAEGATYGDCLRVIPTVAPTTAPEPDDGLLAEVWMGTAMAWLLILLVLVLLYIVYRLGKRTRKGTTYGF